MALSGVYNQNVGSHWRLRVEWSATQNISNNTSTVTANLYWEARDSYGAVNSSVSKSAGIYINGRWSRTSSATARLSGNQKRRIHRYTRTLSHDSDGSLRFDIAAEFNAEVTLSGTYYGRIYMPSRFWNLNTIPRGSSLSSNQNWTAGNNKTISISRHSTSFRHEVDIRVLSRAGYYNLIKTLTFSSSETSKSTSFSSSENEQIFRWLDGRSSTESRLVLRTYNGSSQIHASNNHGTITAPSASGLTSGTDREMFIDGSVNIGISRNNSNFTHDVEIECGSFSKKFTGVNTSVTFNPTSSERTSLYNQITDSNSRSGSIKITTYYGNQQVRSTRSFNFTFKVRNSDPTFTGEITYRDANPVTVALTGNDQFIIQNNSRLEVQIPSSATASPTNGATISHYEVIVNGESKRANFSSGEVTVDFDTVSANSNTSIQVRAVDSRGNYATVSKNVNILPYTRPSISFSANRANGFEANTILRISGRAQPLNIGSENKNRIEAIAYRYRRASDSSFGSYTQLSYSGFPNYKVDDFTVELPTDTEYVIEVMVMDTISSTSSQQTVNVGMPIFLIDSQRKSIGFGDFPNSEDQVFMNMRLVFGSNMYASKAGEEDFGAGAIYMNNSDMTGINGLYFSHDSSNTVREGINFIKSTAPSESPNSSDYDNFKIRDGVMYFNDKPVAYDSRTPLWEGNLFLTEISELVPSKNLRDCANGWMLAWTNSDTHYGWQFSLIPKEHLDNGIGGILRATLVTGGNDTTVLVKNYFARNDRVIGSASNNVGASRDMKLRYIYEY